MFPENNYWNSTRIETINLKNEYFEAQDRKNKMFEKTFPPGLLLKSFSTCQGRIIHVRAPRQRLTGAPLGKDLLAPPHNTRK